MKIPERNWIYFECPNCEGNTEISCYATELDNIEKPKGNNAIITLADLEKPEVDIFVFFIGYCPKCDGLIEYRVPIQTIMNRAFKPRKGNGVSSVRLN